MIRGKNMKMNRKKNCPNFIRADDKKRIDSINSEIIKFGIPKTVLVDDGSSFNKVKKQLY